MALELDKEQFEKLCALQCTLAEIAGWFSVSKTEVERWCRRCYKKKFPEVFEEKRQAGIISLRRNQFRLAETSAAMGIWLGKQYLGQTDKIQLIQPNPQMDALIEAIKGASDEVQPETAGDDPKAVS